MVLQTLPWDPVDYLGDEEAIGAYLDAALEDGDPKLIAAALGDIARAKGIFDLASRTGLSHESLRHALSVDGNPDFASIMKIVVALGLQLATRPKRAANAA